MAKNNIYVQYTTPEFTAAFPKIFTPDRMKDSDKLQYSIVMLFDKSTDLTVFKKKVENAARELFGDLQGVDLPFRDGNDPKVAAYNGYKDHIYVNAKSSVDNKPKVLDQKKLPIVNEELIYAGCKCRASVSIHPYDTAGKKGVSVYLNGVQLTGNGEPLVSNRDCTDDFDEVEVEDAEDDLLS